MTEELTAPVQKNFYAVGYKYLVGYGENKKPKTYIGSCTLSDGHVEHIFAYELYNESTKIPFAVADTYHDKLVELFVSEE